MEPKQQMVFKHNPSVSTYYFAVNNLFAGQIRIQTWDPATGWCNTFFFCIQIYYFWVQYKVTVFSWPKKIKFSFIKLPFLSGRKLPFSKSDRFSREKVTVYCHKVAVYFRKSPFRIFVENKRLLWYRSVTYHYIKIVIVFSRKSPFLDKVTVFSEK